MDHTVLPANNTMPAFPSLTFTRWHHRSNWGSRHPIAAYYSLIFYLLFSSPNLSRRRLDIYHTSTHGVALVRI